MIQCPQCSKDIADDSAHCGYCGAKIETGGGKKTMIGFAAVTGDALREAAAEAKRAREAAAQDASAAPTQPPQPMQPPQPEQPPQPLTQSGPLGGPSSPSVPTPQHGIDARQLDMSAAAFDDAPTEMMSAVPSSSSAPTVDEQAPSHEPLGSAPATVPTPGLAAKTQPEQTALDGPSQFGGGFESDGPSEFGSGSMQVAQPTVPDTKKNNNKMIIAAVIAVPALGMLCCVGSQVATYVFALL